MAETIREKLQARFAPSELEVIDDSAKHAGHSGARTGGESHFTVKIKSRAFEGASRVERQRQIHVVLAQELAGPVHALSIVAGTPEDA